VNVTTVTAMARPQTIHDFYGFPRQLFAIEYPAPGDPKLADEVAEIGKPRHVGLAPDGWDLDHPTWSVLVHAFPKADIPVVQVFIDARKRFDEHVALGAGLAPLRASGVLVIGSGNVVPNPRAIDWSRPDDGVDWAHRFDEAARATLTGRPNDLGGPAGPRRFLARGADAGSLYSRPVLGRSCGGVRAASRGAGGRLCVRLDFHDCLYARRRLSQGGRPEWACRGLPDPYVLPPEDRNL
jgi:hypothetical protein